MVFFVAAEPSSSLKLGNCLGRTRGHSSELNDLAGKTAPDVTLNYHGRFNVICVYESALYALSARFSIRRIFDRIFF